MPKRKVTQVEFAPRLGDFGRAPTAKLRVDAELRAITEEMEVVAGLIEKSIATNAITALDQDEYAKNYESLTERYQALQKRYTTLTRQREDKQFKADELMNDFYTNFRKAIAFFYKKVYNTCTT